MNSEIKNLAERLARLEEVLAAAAAGNFTSQIDLDIEAADDLTSVETGINLLISDLADEVKKTEELTAELERERKK